ncbi:MAG: SAM-dependent DNA methyltransferase [Marinilabiliaceae bacterium]|nr:SAM-dependent DNA methyltransferase [Marinilabiliaceae bacterium]
MITGELKSQVDKIWEAFWTGGVSNPLTVIEQFTFLLFIRRLDEKQRLDEKKASIAGIPLQNTVYTEAQAGLRWNNFKHKDAESMFALFTTPQVDGFSVFEHMKQVGEVGGVFAEYMKGATFMIPTPRLLDMVVQMIDKIKMDDRDTKGDLYEYLLSKIATAGTNGQFRTPRHIIKMMVDMVQPHKEELICDPSCGSAGFLVAAGEYFHENHKEWFHERDFREHYNCQMFSGIEFDPTMLRIGAMNMQLHGIETPTLIGKDSLSESNGDIRETYSLILANPPFKGSLDYDAVEESLLKTVKTKKTELLFLGLMLRMLKTGGRCAVIIPDGVLFGSSKAHKQIRQEIIENHKLDAVISMPSGVFKPYAGVSTAVLFFTKTNSGGTDKVWFYDMKADGFSLDDKRTPLANGDANEHEKNNIPDIIEKYRQVTAGLDDDTIAELVEARTEQSFLVPFDEIKSNDWDLSINRYKEIVYEEVEYDAPKDIIGDIKELDKQRAEALKVLEELLNA